MKHSLTVSLLLIAMVVPAYSAAQDDTEYQMELGAGIGGSFYLGDVNSVMYKNTGFAGAILARYIMNPRMALKGMLSYGTIKGSTSSVNNFYPDDIASGSVSTQRRNYSFSGSVVDFSIIYELHFLPYGIGNAYLGYSRLTPFLQLGIGGLYGTEAKDISANIPLGFGLKYKLSSRLNLALDWTIHFSLSDKLDGMDSPLGIKGSGFKNKDHYSQTMLTLTYDIAPKCINCNKE